MVVILQATAEREMSLKEGQRVVVLRGKVEEGWWSVQDVAGSPGEALAKGFVPASYLLLEDPELDKKMSAHRRKQTNSKGTGTGSGSGQEQSPRRGPRTLVVVARFDFVAKNAKELDFTKGERLRIANPVPEKQWWMAENRHHVTGFVPTNFLKFRRVA